MNLKHELRYIREIKDRDRKRPLITEDNISYRNWWKTERDKNWFTTFAESNIKGSSEKIRFYSVFGPRKALNECFDGKKVFYSGENLERVSRYRNLKTDEVAYRVWMKRYREYGDYALSEMNLSLGFAEKKDSNYIRFPLWITFLFSPDSTYEEIKDRINCINNRQVSTNREGTALIASHDQFGSREYIYNDLKDVVDIQCAGKWNHNTDLLRDKYGDGKIDYLFYKKFNICPENVDASGYVTEKLFDAFAAGTIPIYQGDGNNPEPKVINRNAVIFWNFESGNNEENIKLISKLDSDDDLYREFMMQPVFKEGAAEVVWSYFERLKNGLM